jgi:putative toxin-antitoxin system antitoxin component (TIGR02293 family)
MRTNDTLGRVLGRRLKDDADSDLVVHYGILAGVPVKAIKFTAKRLGIPGDDLASSCGISRTTFHRLTKTGVKRLAPQASDALVRHAKLFDLAVEVLEDEGAAREWLHTPQVGLGGEIPLDMARTSMGSREVEKLLTQINYGVYV